MPTTTVRAVQISTGVLTQLLSVNPKRIAVEFSSQLIFTAGGVLSIIAGTVCFVGTDQMTSIGQGWAVGIGNSPVRLSNKTIGEDVTKDWFCFMNSPGITTKIFVTETLDDGYA